MQKRLPWLVASQHSRYKSISFWVLPSKEHRQDALNRPEDRSKHEQRVFFLDSRVMNPLLFRKGTAVPECPFAHRFAFRVWCLWLIVWCSWSSPTMACPTLIQGTKIDVVSKAHLAPVVFQGRLLRLQAQWPVIRAVFRVQKLYKDSVSPLVDEKSDVVVEFSTEPTNAGSRKTTACRGIAIDAKELKVHQRYLVFASPKKSRILVAVARPEPPTKRKALVRVLCEGCARQPTVMAMGNVRVEIRTRLRLKCEFSGNPPPRIAWFKNGYKIRPNDRIRIKSKKRFSRLVIQRVNRLDSGKYECKATNVLGDASGLARVVVTSLPEKRPPVQHHTNDSTLWPLQGLPCPMASYCLNGGTCSLYETVGEYVCECAEGYRGRRCEDKAISTLSSPAPLDAPQSPHNLDATTRMLQHYWGK